MSLTLRTNRWASRIIIILHLVIWNAVGIVLLQKGVSILRRRILETNGHTIEINSSIDLSIESTVPYKNEYDFAVISGQQQSINQNEKIVIQVDSESFLEDNRNYPRLNVITNSLRNDLEIASEEQRSALSNPFGNSTTDRENKLRVGNRLTETNRRIDQLENKGVPSKVSRIARNKEPILGKGILRDVRAEENITRPGSVSESQEEKEEEDEEDNRDARGKDRNSLENASATRKPKSFARNIGEQTNADNAPRRSGDRLIKFSQSGGATTAVAMVTIGAIMLLIGPIVIILRILDERRQARKLHALSVAAREDLPPTYEQAVFMSEAPRYSSLALNDDHSSSLPSPSPPPSPTFAYSNLVIKPHST